MPNRKEIDIGTRFHSWVVVAEHSKIGGGLAYLCRCDCGETDEEKIARLTKWHPFFAVFPKLVGSHDCRCLEWVERRGHYFYLYDEWIWEYRAREGGK